MGQGKRSDTTNQIPFTPEQAKLLSGASASDTVAWGGQTAEVVKKSVPDPAPAPPAPSDSVSLGEGGGEMTANMADSIPAFGAEDWPDDIFGDSDKDGSDKDAPPAQARAETEGQGAPAFPKGAETRTASVQGEAAYEATQLSETQPSAPAPASSPASGASADRTIVFAKPRPLPKTGTGAMGLGVGSGEIARDVRNLSEEADFVLQNKIGQGGQGEVWRAWQSSLQRDVAIKRMIAGHKASFLQEAYTSAQLDHPNIVPIYDLASVKHAGGGESPLIAMKMVRGVPWSHQIDAARKVKVRRFSLELFLANHIPVLIDVCNAVAYAHSKGIIHRDLKPAQVMIGEFGEVFLMDWGLAISIRSKADIVPRHGIPKHQTRATAANCCGSPAFMAPEQTAQTTSGLGFHTDVYLLGGILYKLVTGVAPHIASNAVEAVNRAAANDYDPLPPECPQYLRELIESCLATDPDDRPPSALKLREALQNYLNGADRQRESKQTVSEVQTVVETFGRENLDYEQLALFQQRLARALQLWPGNEDAKALLRRLTVIHAELALEAGDLELGKTIALGLPDESEKERLTAEIESAEQARALEAHDAKEMAFRVKVLYGLLGLFALVAIGEALLLLAIAGK